MTITIKPTTKKAEQMRARAKHYDGYELRDVYESYSDAKASAYKWCFDQCCREGGWNFHITSHNTFGFTVAWDMLDGVRIETPSNSYFIPNC